MAAEHDKRRQIAAWLRPGRIVLLPFPDANNRKKYFVVGATRPDLLLMVINSVPRQWNANCIACQVGLKRDPDYPFFRIEESYANCYEVVDSISYYDAVQQLADHPRWMKGQINDATKAAVRAAINDSERIAPIRQRALLLALV